MTRRIVAIIFLVAGGAFAIVAFLSGIGQGLANALLAGLSGVLLVVGLFRLVTKRNFAKVFLLVGIGLAVMAGLGRIKQTWTNGALMTASVILLAAGAIHLLKGRADGA